jgi:hypothetical protein
MATLELLVEEESCKEAVRILLPKILPPKARFNIRSFQGKADLLKKLPERLDGYNNLPVPERNNLRILILVDRDDEDCEKLKKKLEILARDKGFITKTRANGGSYQLTNRIAIEELEAWFLGDADALLAAYPSLRKAYPNFAKRKECKTPDNIQGGTWETLERMLKRAGYYSNGLPKKEAARLIAAQMNPDKNTSPSFKLFRDAVREIMTL